MSKVEDGFAEYAEEEIKWMRTFVEMGVFNPLFLKLLEDVHQQIERDPKNYLEGVLNFEYVAYMRNLTGYEIPPNVNLVNPKIYIARLIVSQPEKGVGFNIVVGPNDAFHPEVSKELYPRFCSRVSREQMLMPFGALWADGYYLQGSTYNQGERDTSIDSGYEVFEYWKQTYEYLHTPMAWYFRLQPPYMPPDAKEIMEKIVTAPAKPKPNRRAF